MGKIAVLDRHMVNMIAAGEVIERPGSVVKELMENSIDAGASRVVLEIEDGGRKLIRVIDDGVGMDADDLSKAFLPHATSKIITQDDLVNISTLGFRGEALASIGSVAKVSIVSRIADSIEANRIDIDCGEGQTIKPCSGDYGTTIEVHNLFYKTPARRKFMKTANTEMGHIQEMFTRIGLAKRDIELVLKHNERTVHQLKAGETLSQRVKKLFPDAVSEDLIEIDSDEKGMKIYGLVGMPNAARANGKYQYVFLNGRFIRDKFISHAMKESYRGLIEPGKFPIAFLFLEMAGDGFDVNVHPTKIEVRFDNSNLVHSQVMAVIKEKLRSIDLDATASFRKAGLAGTDEHAGEQDEGVRNAIDDFFKRHKPPVVANQNKFNFGGSGEASADRSEARENFRQNFYAQPEVVASGSAKVMQIHDSYILAESDEGFVMIDQHALHERILYQKMLAKIESGEKLESQKQLIPVSFDVSDSQAELIEQNLELLGKVGIEVEAFGPGVMAVQSFPVLLGKADIAVFMRDMVDIMAEKGAVGTEELVHEVLDMAACKAAIKAGQKLTVAEMEQLLKDKETAERSSNCPHGRPSTIKFTISDIESQFKRT